MIEITDQLLKDRPLSASSLKAFRESPKHYIEYLTGPKKDIEAYLIGKATECLILQPEKFDKQFLLYEKFEKRSNDAKAKWAKMVEDSKANRTSLIDQQQYDKAKIMAQSALDTDETRYYIDHKRNIQKKLEWTDLKTKLPIIGYIDFDCDFDGHTVIVDIKTANDGNPDKFSRDAANLDYQVQVGAYLTGYHKMYYKFPDFMFMVIESTPPYDAIMVHCEPDYCQKAKDEFEYLLTAFRHCMNEKQFNRGRHFWSAELGYFNMQLPKYKKLKSATNE